MAKTNETQVNNFILLGLSDHLQSSLFVFFFFIYVFTLMGNILIIFTVTWAPQLHSPMYFFLRNLSLTEIFYISVTVPRMLRDFLHQDKHISFFGCAGQLYFFCFLGTTECFLLAFMAYDRYAAICHPLHYVTKMSKTKCLMFSLGSWMAGMILSLGQISFVFSLPFCKSNIIDHFFCDILPVVKLACSDTFANELAILIYSSFVIPFPFLLIVVSYVRILISVMRIRSAAGRTKTFSTCGSHLTSVSLFYGTATITYLRTKSNDTPRWSKVFSLLYIVFIPMLNPLIYSLRNKEMKKAMKMLLHK
ncbi:olfactory receptor 10A7-like [Bombina bombina]|uniref:olfactory receptor 10A7-like n=1 Tax=Bombina bombina TaxID=8345 RepID=UPI00235AB93C|nr:olfactory receptor 10A7-like [Bombina bombina]